MNHTVLLISCPDQKGITAAVTRFIAENDGNIVHADQHIDGQTQTFFMRLEWDRTEFRLSMDETARAFAAIADRFGMDWRLFDMAQRPRVAVFVSRHLHCLDDLLLRHKAGHLPCDIVLLISNHPLARRQAEEFGVPFHEFPITPETKHRQEEQEIALLKTHRVDLVVLARYHQILTQGFIDHFPNRIINIHHSFLPAFAGKAPYAQAYAKGVKIIGATSHFVTADLDQGPIIDQDIVRVSHRDSLEDLIRKGEDLERIVLSRALRWALQRKVLCYGNKTVVFD